jgi:D-tyrosyl-tRNA(Tyr) deacylase
MKALVQRVTRARCTVEGRVTGEIAAGLLILLGVHQEDAATDAAWLAHKLAGLRIFADGEKRMNRDVREAGGAALVIPQFTLYGDTRRGRRPDFLGAARPEHAEPLFQRFCAALEEEGVPVERGVFRAHMEVELVNDGPVTLMVEAPAAGVRPSVTAAPGGGGEAG